MHRCRLKECGWSGCGTWYDTRRRRPALSGACGSCAPEWHRDHQQCSSPSHALVARDEVNRCNREHRMPHTPIAQHPRLASPSTPATPLHKMVHKSLRQRDSGAESCDATRGILDPKRGRPLWPTSPDIARRQTSDLRTTCRFQRDGWGWQTMCGIVVDVAWV